MFDWFFIFIPISISILILIFWFRKVVWWEILLLIVPSFLIILLLNTIMISYNTSDTEYLGSYITNVNYYEPWDEKVSCRHPIYCTRSYPCGTSKSPRTCTSTYVCGHLHAYDVDNHPEYWTKENNKGHEYEISHSEFNNLKKRFKTKEKFIELNRDYYSIDGDCFSTVWNGEPYRSSVIVEEGSYVNKIKASHSIFKFENITEKEIKKWELYEYPQVVNLQQKVVLGKKVKPITERKLQYLNGFYGPHKQFKTFILFFKNKSKDVVRKQRSYWEGGNKNELIICIGVDKSGDFQWVDAFSWMDKPSLEVEVEDFFYETEDVKLDKFADWMPKKIEKLWHRRDFKDFEYLQLELTETQLWWVMIILMIYNVLISIWVINNESENKFISDKFSEKIDSLFLFFKKIMSNFALKFKNITDKLKDKIYEK